MLDEYMGRRLDDESFIESFYPNEVAAADHFERVLREFCVDESLPPRWRRETGEVGHITFTGKRIAESINRSYTPNARFGYSSDPPGVLDPKVLKSASREQMLRYVAGAYVRDGDGDGRLKNQPPANRAFFSTPNGYSKFCVLSEFLARLGCTHIRFYNDIESKNVPTSNILTFRPTDEVKARTGIRREVTSREMKAMNPDWKETTLPHF